MLRPTQTMSSREFNQSTGAAKRAAHKGPVYITYRGQPSHVLLSYDDYLGIVDRTSIATALSSTRGIGGIEVDFPRLRDLGQAAAFD